MNLKAALFVFIGGGLGSTLRYAFHLYFRENSFLQALLPNLIGCFLLGLFTHLWVGEGHPLRLMLVLGCLGGLTTFSGYVGFIGQSGFLTPHALTYFLLNNVLGIACYAVALKAVQAYYA